MAFVCSQPADVRACSKRSHIVHTPIGKSLTKAGETGNVVRQNLRSEEGATASGQAVELPIDLSALSPELVRSTSRGDTGAMIGQGRMIEYHPKVNTVAWDSPNDPVPRTQRQRLRVSAVS